VGGEQGPGIAPENPFVSQASYKQHGRDGVILEDHLCKILFIAAIKPGSRRVYMVGASLSCDLLLPIQLDHPPDWLILLRRFLQELLRRLCRIVIAPQPR